MCKTVVPALSVLAAEAVIRRKINALPPETFPLRIGQRVQLRRFDIHRMPYAAKTRRQTCGGTYQFFAAGIVSYAQ